MKTILASVLTALVLSLAPAAAAPAPEEPVIVVPPIVYSKTRNYLASNRPDVRRANLLYWRVEGNPDAAYITGPGIMGDYYDTLISGEEITYLSDFEDWQLGEWVQVCYIWHGRPSLAPPNDPERPFFECWQRLPNGVFLPVVGR